MVFKKADSQNAANKKAVSKKILDMAVRYRSRSRSWNGGTPEYHTTPSEELSAIAHAPAGHNQVMWLGEEQYRRETWYRGTVHFHNELEQKGLLGIGIAPGELK